MYTCEKKSEHQMVFCVKIVSGNYKGQVAPIKFFYPVSVLTQRTSFQSHFCNAL